MLKTYNVTYHERGKKLPKWEMTVRAKMAENAKKQITSRRLVVDKVRERR